MINFLHLLIVTFWKLGGGGGKWGIDDPPVGAVLVHPTEENMKAELFSSHRRFWVWTLDDPKSTS